MSLASNLFLKTLGVRRDLLGKLGVRRDLWHPQGSVAGLKLGNHCSNVKLNCRQVGWGVAIEFVYGAGGLRFKSWADEIEHKVTAATFLRKKAVLPRHNDEEMKPQTRYPLRRSIASIIKDLIKTEIQKGEHLAHRCTSGLGENKSRKKTDFPVKNCRVVTLP